MSIQLFRYKFQGVPPEDFEAGNSILGENTTNMASSAPSSSEYVHLSPKEHILHRGEMYIGSFAHEERECWLYDKDALIKSTINTPEAQARLILEIL